MIRGVRQPLCRRAEGTSSAQSPSELAFPPRGHHISWASSLNTSEMRVAEALPFQPSMPRALADTSTSYFL